MLLWIMRNLGFSALHFAENSAILSEWENIQKNIFPSLNWMHEYFLDWIHASNN